MDAKKVFSLQSAFDAAPALRDRIFPSVLAAKATEENEASEADAAGEVSSPGLERLRELGFAQFAGETEDDESDNDDGDSDDEPSDSDEQAGPEADAQS